MEFHEKLQELRKQSRLTQEQLAERLFVSRTAVSKWESGRGYPGIDSLREISKFFSVSLDDLLSNEELLTAAQEDGSRRLRRFRDLASGLLDCAAAAFLFLPVFGQRRGAVEAVSLLALTGAAPHVRAACLALVIGTAIFGVLTLALQNCGAPVWSRIKSPCSLLLSFSSTLLFIAASQPYAAALALIFLSIKSLMLFKRA